MENNSLPIIPFAIVNSIAKLDNIFEVRLFGWIFAKAQACIKGFNNNMQKINIERALRITRVTLPARYLLPKGSTNYSPLKKCFTLATKKIHWKYGEYDIPLTIIAFPELIKTKDSLLLTFLIHDNLWHALLDFAKGWRRVDLEVFMRFESVYTATMYLLLSNQNKSITFDIEKCKEFFNCTNIPSYKKNTNFINRVIKPAQHELTEKANITFELETKTGGRGGAIRFITFHPRINFPDYEGNREIIDTINWQRVNLDNRVTEYLRNNLHLTTKEAEQIESLVKRAGNPEQQIEALEKYRHAIMFRAPDKPLAYLVTCLKKEFAAS